MNVHICDIEVVKGVETVVRRADELAVKHLIALAATECRVA